MKRVLSLDGGGIRGLFTARILAEIERRSGKQIHELFDLIAGVSTGGILACMLTAPDEFGGAWMAKSIQSFYVNEGPNIFNAGLGRKLLGGWGTLKNRYSSYGLKAALNKYLPYQNLDKTLIPILVSAFDIVNNQPFFFKTTKAREDVKYQFRLKDVAWATAAAPTYFDPAVVNPVILQGTSNQQVLIDGGIFGTNPTMHARAEASRLWPGEPAVFVSIGTGDVPAKNDPKKFMGAGDLAWVAPLLDMMFAGSSTAVDYQMGWSESKYFRLNQDLKYASSAMDDASKCNLANLVKDAEQLIAAQSDQIDIVLRILT